MLLSLQNPKQLSPKKTIFTLLLKDQRLKNALPSSPWSHVPSSTGVIRSPRGLRRRKEECHVL